MGWLALGPLASVAQEVGQLPGAVLQVGRQPGAVLQVARQLGVRHLRLHQELPPGRLPAWRRRAARDSPRCRRAVTSHLRLSCRVAREALHPPVVEAARSDVEAARSVVRPLVAAATRVEVHLVDRQAEVHLVGPQAEVHLVDPQVEVRLADQQLVTPPYRQ